jgi:hypothetical protein
MNVNLSQRLAGGQLEEMLGLQLGYDLMPACRKCLDDPNDNDVDGHDQQ